MTRRMISSALLALLVSLGSGAWPALAARVLSAHHVRRVPLESVPLAGSKNSEVLTSANPGHFAGQAINAGLQFNVPDSYALYTLGGRYATLAGTVFDDDGASGNDTTFVVVDMSARVPRVLYQTNLSGNLRVGFQVAVRGVNRLALEQTHPGGGPLDVLATLTLGRHVPVVVVRGTPLESLPALNSSDSTLLTPDKPGHTDGVLIMHGVQLDGDGAYAQYALTGRYRVLTGAFYNDDQSNGTNAALAIVDTSGRTHRVLFHATISLSDRRSFQVAVRGVRRLTVEEAQQGAPTIDVVASVD